MQNFVILATLFLVEKKGPQKERRRRRKMPSTMATTLRWRRHSARTKIESPSEKEKSDIMEQYNSFKEYAFDLIAGVDMTKEKKAI
jgi:hypothetical protein